MNSVYLHVSTFYKLWVLSVRLSPSLALRLEHVPTFQAPYLTAVLDFRADGSDAFELKLLLAFRAAYE